VLTGHGKDHREASSALRTPAFEARELDSMASAGDLLDCLA
jgi:hypothetical protein